MSPIDNDKMASIRGRKTPGKPGRFDPSEPLHMTTRRAAKSGTTNGSPSINGSLDDEASRRGSLDDLRPLTSQSNGSQVSAKSRRISDLSLANVTPPNHDDNNHLNGLYSQQSSEDKMNGRSKSKALSPVDQTPSPSRKRKRSSSTSPQQSSMEQPDSIPTASFDTYASGLSFADEGDVVEVIPPEDLSDRERAPSQESIDSEADATHGDAAMAEASMDATPVVSEPVSPATSESRSHEDALTKPLDAALEKITQEAAEDEPDDQDDADDGVDAGDDAEGEEADEVDEPAEDDGRPRRGRVGGRRRQKHPNPKVEKAMARQAELKSAYRAIARAQKQLLAEIAQRTVDDLETKPDLHLQAHEYNTVKAGLDSAYEKRRNQITAQQDWNKQQLQRTRDAETHMVKTIYEERLSELRDEMLVQLEHEMLQIARKAQIQENATGYETEDEDDVVPMPKKSGYKFCRSGAIGRPFDSRSRETLHVNRAITESEGRYNMHQLLSSLTDDEVATSDDAGFTVMDSARREMAQHKKASIQSTNLLADAAAETKTTIPNEEALGLQLLGELASRPAIAGPVPPPSKGGFESFVRQTPPHPTPPHLQVSTNYGPNSIPVEMSPRTTQALGDRFDAAMPPPLTPRQGPSSFVPSPGAVQAELPVMSPPNNTPQLNGQTFARQSFSQPASRRGTFTEHMNSPADHTNGRPDLAAAPFRFEERRADLPTWREYPSNGTPASARRTSFNNDGRTPFTFPGSLLARGDRETDVRSGNKREEGDRIKNESSPPKPFGSTIKWPEPLSQAGAPDARTQDVISPEDEPRGPWRPLHLAPRSPGHSRNTSATLSVHDRRRDSDGGDGQNLTKGVKGGLDRKASKAERGGLPRRQWSKDHKKLSRSLDKSGSAASPNIASRSFAGSPIERAPPPAPWQGPQPPQHSPIGPPPPTAFHHRPSVPFGPARPQFSPGPPTQEFYQHRTGFPPPQQQAPTSIWNQPQSHLYAVPQSPHPPPPGVVPEQFNRFAPPPPPSYQAPHPPHTPHSQHPQSAPGSYGHQFGGPPLAPATPNTGFHPPGLRPGQPHQPAFAQQAQQQQGGRRRAASDAHATKFFSWTPNRG